MCGGFYCSRNTLILLNLMYIVVGGLLIASTFYSNRFMDLPILPSVISCGIVLISLAVFGVYGAMKHHQVILFFYMIILFCLFIVQFAIACSCLAVSRHQQENFAVDAWDTVSNEVKVDIQNTYHCCGFNSTDTDDHPSCENINKICCQSKADCVSCPLCMPILESSIDSAFFTAGSIGLIFSFTEVIAVFVTKKYRNQRNPIYDLLPRAVFPTENYEYC